MLIDGAMISCLIYENRTTWTKQRNSVLSQREEDVDNDVPPGAVQLERFRAKNYVE